MLEPRSVRYVCKITDFDLGYNQYAITNINLTVMPSVSCQSILQSLSWYDLIKILETEYRTITPLYYWASREGGINSRSCFTGKSIQVLAFLSKTERFITLDVVLFGVRSMNYSAIANSIFKVRGNGVSPLLNNWTCSFLPCLWFDISPDELRSGFTIDIENKSLFEGMYLEPSIKKEILAIINRFSLPMPLVVST